MKVKAVGDFTAVVEGQVYYVEEGEVFDLPEGARWLTAGLVVPVRERKAETAVRKPQEKAVTRSRKRKTNK